MGKLNGDDRKKRRKKKLIAKRGICPRYSNAKVKYTCRAVAEFDRSCLQAANPDQVYEAFKCDRGGGGGCGRWHVGKPDGNGDYIIVNVGDDDDSET